MGMPRRDKVARTMLIWTVVAVIVTTVASCTHVISGRAVLAGPKIGQPVQWGPCRVSGGTAVKLPAGVQCGKLAVPVNYNHLGRDATTLAMVRFRATGDKIGSLVINPGGPGESGIEAALGIVGSLPPRVRERFDLVGFDPRGVAASRP
ncbi:MAG: alpha/beta hydrolase, partial [Mycobacterium sp.]